MSPADATAGGPERDRNSVGKIPTQGSYDLSADPHGDVEDKDKIGRNGDTFYGHGYRYVVPQLGRWKSPSKAEGGSGECQDGGPIHNSWLSLDRAAEPDRLVTGEFCAKAMDVPPGRVAMWDMKEHDIAADSDGVATSTSVLGLPPINEANHGANVQGGATTNGGGDWFFSISHGKSAGELRRYSRTDTDWVAKGTKTTPMGPEDLTYRYRTSKHLLYSVSEYPHERVIYARNADSGW